MIHPKWHDTRPRNRADTQSSFSLLVLHCLGEFLRSNAQSNAADDGWSSFFWFALIPEITSAHLKKTGLTNLIGSWSLLDVKGSALVVSQFTLYGDARAQRRRRLVNSLSRLVSSVLAADRGIKMIVFSRCNE